MPLATRQLVPGFAVAAQLGPQDMPAVVRAGFRTLINNRPDREGGAAQPLSAAWPGAASKFCWPRSMAR